MKILIFGGTIEGRELCNAHLRAGNDVVMCVTSHYAQALLPPGVHCIVGALTEGEMERVIAAETPDRILDATHPFAVHATENIRAAAQALGVPCERVNRPDAQTDDWLNDVQWVRDANDAAHALAHTNGNILLTTGVNTLPIYAKALPLSRLYARVLPSVRSLSVCESLSLPPGHVIAMQGPFTEELNAALYDMLHIRAMVSKNSGAAGGVREKVIPALTREIHVVMIERPKE